MSHLKAFFVMGFLLIVVLLVSSEVAAAEAQAKNKVSFEDAKYVGGGGGEGGSLVSCPYHGCCLTCRSICYRCCSYIGEPKYGCCPI